MDTAQYSQQSLLMIRDSQQHQYMQIGHSIHLISKDLLWLDSTRTTRDLRLSDLVSLLLLDLV